MSASAILIPLVHCTCSILTPKTKIPNQIPHRKGRSQARPISYLTLPATVAAIQCNGGAYHLWYAPPSGVHHLVVCTTYQSIILKIASQKP